MFHYPASSDWVALLALGREDSPGVLSLGVNLGRAIMLLGYEQDLVVWSAMLPPRLPHSFLGLLCFPQLPFTHLDSFLSSYLTVSWLLSCFVARLWNTNVWYSRTVGYQRCCSFVFRKRRGRVYKLLEQRVCKEVRIVAPHHGHLNDECPENEGLHFSGASRHSQ